MKQFINDAKPATWLRHLGAMMYDLFLVCALFIAVGFIFIIFSKGEVIREGTLLWVFRGALMITWALFFIYFWSAQAQTLGMRAWRLVVTDENGQSIGFLHAAKRFFWAVVTLLPCGFGLWWRIFDPKNLTLYDRLSHSRLYFVPINPYQRKK